MENKTLKIWGMALFITLGIVGGIAALIKTKAVKIVASKSNKLKKDAKILFVGDSRTTEFYNGLPTYTYSYQIKHKFFPDKTIDILAQNNKTTAWMLSVLPSQLNQKKYDRVYIWGGVNDVFSGYTVDQAISNIQSMVDTVVNQGGKAYVIIGYNAESFMLDKFMTTTAMLLAKKKYVEYNKALRSKIKNATIVDEFTGLDSTYTADGIHPNVAGHTIIANNLIKDINYEL